MFLNRINTPKFVSSIHYRPDFKLESNVFYVIVGPIEKLEGMLAIGRKKWLEIFVLNLFEGVRRQVIQNDRGFSQKCFTLLV